MQGDYFGQCEKAVGPRVVSKDGAEQPPASLRAPSYYKGGLKYC